MFLQRQCRHSLCCCTIWSINCSILHYMLRKRESAKEVRGSCNSKLMTLKPCKNRIRQWIQTIKDHRSLRNSVLHGIKTYCHLLTCATCKWSWHKCTHGTCKRRGAQKAWMLFPCSSSCWKLKVFLLVAFDPTEMPYSLSEEGRSHWDPAASVLSAWCHPHTHSLAFLFAFTSLHHSSAFLLSSHRLIL